MKTLILSLFTLASVTSFGQVNRCMSPEAITYQESITPGFADHVNQVFDNALQYASNNQQKSAILYTVPVVVHVVYNTPEQNVPDSVVLDQIKVLTEDYRRLNADTVNMRSDFDIVKGSPQIEFRLAQIDEFGNPTTGITRTQTSTQSFGSLAVMGGDFSDLEKVKSTADGGHDPWDQSRYLNIWVCNMSVNFLGQEVTALLGYATPPAGLPNWPAGSVPNLVDGVVIQYQAFGSNNPVPLDPGTGPVPVLGRTCTHEVGHYLGLRHIWGDGDCTQEDGIADTPNAADQSQQDCDPTKNTCTDNIQGVDLPDMIENYMDYSAETCQNSFTQGQVDLMHGVLEDQRYDLVHNNPASLNEIEEVVWTIAPNPTSGEVKVASLEPLSSITVIGLSGNKLMEIQPTQSTTTLQLNELESGVYFIQVVSNGTMSSKRIVLL